MNYIITILPANIQFPVTSSQTLLAAALQADIDLPYGCQGGACGACMVSKNAGEIRYPAEIPPALQDEDLAANKILCCQAFACSDLILVVPSIGLHKQKILTLPTRVLEKTLTDIGQLVLTLKLPGEQSLPDYIAGQQIEILAGAGKICSTSRLENPEKHSIKLLVEVDLDDSFVNYLFNNLENGEMLRIRGPV